VALYRQALKWPSAESYLYLQPITELYLFTIELKLRDDFRCFRSKMCFGTFSTVPLNSPIYCTADFINRPRTIYCWYVTLRCRLTISHEYCDDHRRLSHYHTGHHTIPSLHTRTFTCIRTEFTACWLHLHEYADYTCLLITPEYSTVNIRHRVLFPVDQTSQCMQLSAYRSKHFGRRWRWVDAVDLVGMSDSVLFAICMEFHKWTRPIQRVTFHELDADMHSKKRANSGERMTT